MNVNYYDVLGVDKDCSDEEVSKAFKRLAKKFHPDTGGEESDVEQFKRVREAFEVLSDSEKRERFHKSFFGEDLSVGDDYFFEYSRNASDYFGSDVTLDDLYGSKDKGSEAGVLDVDDGVEELVRGLEVWMHGEDEWLVADVLEYLRDNREGFDSEDLDDVHTLFCDRNL